MIESIILYDDTAYVNTMPLYKHEFPIEMQHIVYGYPIKGYVDCV